MKQNKQNQLPVVINDCHALLAWIIPQLDHFPRARRFTFARRGIQPISNIYSLMYTCIFCQAGSLKN